MCLVTIVHNVQPLYVWGVSAYLSMLIKINRLQGLQNPAYDGEGAGQNVFPIL